MWQANVWSASELNAQYSTLYTQHNLESGCKLCPGHTVWTHAGHARLNKICVVVRLTFVHRFALGVRWVLATSQPTNTQRIPSVCSGRGYRALVHRSRACPASFWRVHLCVELRAQFCACTKNRRTKRMATNENRWSSALDERVTNDDEQRHTNHFSVRSLCVLHASVRCDRAISFSVLTYLLIDSTAGDARYSVAANGGQYHCDRRRENIGSRVIRGAAVTWSGFRAVPEDVSTAARLWGWWRRRKFVLLHTIVYVLILYLTTRPAAARVAKQCSSSVREVVIVVVVVVDNERLTATTATYRDVRSGLCRSDILTVTAAELIDVMDDDLFQRILRDKNHILHALLPDRRPKLDYEFRPRCHDRQLAPKLSCLTESNFLIRQLYKNCY